MANYKKYAENLIGNWEKDIYAPQQQLAQEAYKTNWDQLTNSFNSLKDQLARNFENARTDYSNILADAQDTSFNRTNAAYNDLANRGLSASGAVNDLIRADTRLKGQEVDRALSDLMEATGENVSGLTEGVNRYGANQTKLASGLAEDLGKLTDADAANNQQYAGLVGSIAESAASRAASNALSRMSRLEKDEGEELKRRMFIAQTLESEDYDDDQKVRILSMYAGVPVSQGKQVVSAYNYEKVQGQINDEQTKLNDYVNKKGLDNRFYTPEAIQIIGNATDDQIRNLAKNGYIGNFGLFGKSKNAAATAPANYNDYLLSEYYNSQMKSFKDLADSVAQGKANKIGGLYKDLSNYTYGDIYNLLYGGK